MTSRPAVPESETPREIFYLPRNGYAGNQPAVWLDDWRRMRRRAEEAERCESLAQTEIKGHMRVEDELRAELKLGPHITGAAPAYTGEGVSMLEVSSAAHVNLRKGRAAIYERALQLERELAIAQARIAELEKVLWNFHLTQARRSTPEAAERAFNELLEVSAALKSRA